MTMTIRRAGAGEGPLLARLNLRVHQLHVDAEPARYKPLRADDPALIAFFDQALTDEAAYLFIAEVTAQPVGYLHGCLRHITGNLFVHNTRDFMIEAMSVEPDYQGQGIGHQLLETALATARELNADTVSLGVAAFNQHAIRFYERHGFATQHRRMRRAV